MKAFRAIQSLLLALAALFLSSAAFAAIHFNAGVITITSASMAPSLRTGDTALTIQESRGEVAAGDVIVLPHPSDPTLKFAHRVVAIDRRDSRVIVETKGDANPVKDAWRMEILSSEVPKVIYTLPTSRLPLSIKERTNLSFALLAFAGFAIAISFRRFRDVRELGARLGESRRSD
jgi:signal peptidase I